TKYCPSIVVGGCPRARLDGDFVDGNRVFGDQAGYDRTLMATVEMTRDRNCRPSTVSSRFFSFRYRPSLSSI
ncbi:hypothetical protein, partial [Klebsiella pneumoniae]|uniref:hypothetical protein n=1 Tax=Klebsiella pneumoniae TaxID=573 RepID=UPI0019D70357